MSQPTATASGLAARAAGILSAIGAAGGGLVKVYSSTPTLLVTFTLPSCTQAAATISASTASAAATPAANGTAATYDLCKSDGTILFTGGTVTDTNGAGPAKLNNLNIVTTSPVTLNSFSHQET